MARLTCLTAVLLLALGCGDDEKASSSEVSVENACDIIVNECGGAEQGFTMTECQNDLGENSFNCVECVVNEGCSFDTACHDPLNGCDVQ